MGETKDKSQCKFDTFTARELQLADIPPLRYIVEDILPEGLAMLVAPPKFGKSWMALDLCESVAAGSPFLGFQTHQSEVLYLALEDGKRRLKSRQEQLFQGRETPETLHFSLAAETVDGALLDQIENFLLGHSQTGLIVIDVLACIRSRNVSPKADAYRLDYKDMTALKGIADKHHICILVIHHTRKMRDDSDVFNMVSGSTGLTGASDTVFIIMKTERTDPRATLHVIGRDVEAVELVIEMQNCKWKRIGTREEIKKQAEMVAFEANSLVRLIQQKVNASESEYKITAQQLFKDLQKQGFDGEELDSSKKIGRFLADDRNKRLFRLIGIEMSEQRESDARYKVFRRCNP